MATYSINIGTPTESTKVENLQEFLNKLPDNTAQLISPRDARDSIFTTWENILIKETSVSGSAIGYIGLDSDTLKAKMLIGKKSYTTQETLNNTLLNSDTDLFIFNGKSDSNPSLQDTKVSFLAGIVPGDYTYAPYIEAQKIALPSRIDLAIVNPATAGVIEINADQIELGDTGWIINDTGALYPVIDGQDLGATPSNRIGNLYMSSRIDYDTDLQFTVGNDTHMVLTDTGTLSVDTISASVVYSENLRITTSATAGYILTSDGIGNANWEPIDVVAPGITAGYILVANGSGDTVWQQNAASSAGASGSVQFSENGLLSSDVSNFYWDNLNKRLGLLTNNPSVELDVVGSGSFSSNMTVGGDLDLTSNANVGGDLTVDGNSTISMTMSTYKLEVTNSISFATAGFGLNKVLTSDANGNASWEAPVVGTGPDNSIQLSDGTGALKYTDNFKWSTDYSSNSLKIGQPTDIGEAHGDGIQMNGNLLIDSNNFIGLNTYNNGGYKRINTGYSSWIKQESTGSLNIYVGASASAGSSIAPFKYIEIDNDTGYVGLNTTPARRLHVPDVMRLEPVSLFFGFSSADGDLYYDDSLNELMSHDASDGGWFKTHNRLLYSINANDMFTDAGVFDGISCSSTGTFRLQDRWTLRSYTGTGDGRVSQFNFILPEHYINGRDVKVVINWTLSGFFFTSLNVIWKIGLTDGGLNYNANDVNTEYIDWTFNTGTAFYQFNNIQRSFTFNGTGLQAGDPISILAIRDNSDTYNGTVYLSHIEVSMV